MKNILKAQTYCHQSQGHLLRWFFLSLLMLTVACNRVKEPKSNGPEKVVNLSIWGDYISPELIRKFEEKTGIRVNLSTFSSNEELLAKVQAGASGVDVAVPSDYMVAIMTKLGLLKDLDKGKIPNSAKVDPRLLNQQFDPQNLYSLPYTWSTAGIAVNRDLFKGEIKSWRDVFSDPELSGKVSLLDDVREVTAAALKMHGYSVNTTKAEELKKAEEVLLKVKPRIKMFRSNTVDVLVGKQVAVAQAYSTDALQAAAKSGQKIEYILPEEGGTKAIDTLVILKDAPHPEAAHKLINFMLSEEVNVEFVKTMWGGPVLNSTRDQLPEVVKKSQALFPSPEKLSKFENIVDLGENTKLYDDLWTRVKTN
jgi:spermidine/putrescine transport system substrate-binding protein